MRWDLMSDQAKDFPVRSESSPPGIDREDLPLSSSYAVLQISPDASREEISAAYDCLKNTWREDRYAQVQAWRDKTKVKLAEIENAYDTILKSLLHESTDRRRDPDLIRDDPSLVLPGDESQVQVDEKPTYIDKTHTKSRTSSRHLRMALATALLIVAIVTCVLLIWLNLYRYDVIKSGNTVFPLRINRLTGATTYFNGSEWVHPPVPLVPSGRTPLKAETAPQGIAVTPVPMPTGQEKETRRDIPEQKTSGKVAQSMSIAAPASPDTQKALTTKKPFSVAKDKPLKGGKYSIQIKAFQEEAEAKSFLNDVKTRHADAHLQKAIIGGKGIWYRVLIGYYPTWDQALAYLKKQGIADTYPGSFVQKTGTR